MTLSHQAIHPLVPAPIQMWRPTCSSLLILVPVVSPVGLAPRKPQRTDSCRVTGKAKWEQRPRPQLKLWAHWELRWGQCSVPGEGAPGTPTCHNRPWPTMNGISEVAGQMSSRTGPGCGCDTWPSARAAVSHCLTPSH